MLQVTAESYFEDDRTRQADALVAHKLLENYDKAAERRNDIAHGIVTEITAGRLGRFGHFLVPPDYNERRTKPPGRIDRLYRKSHGISPGFKMSRNRAYLARVKFAYASYDIAGFADKFGELALAVEFFIQNLSTFRQFGAS